MQTFNFDYPVVHVVFDGDVKQKILSNERFGRSVCYAYKGDGSSTTVGIMVQDFDMDFFILYLGLIGNIISLDFYQNGMEVTM